MRRHRMSSALLSASTLLIASVALAQPGTPPPPGAAPPPAAPPPYAPEVGQRQKLTFGFGLGVGSLVADCTECRETFEAGGLDAHIGWMLNPRLALVLDVWGMVHREAFLTVFQNVNTIGAIYWATPLWWIQGGFGNANAGYEWDGIFVNREDRTAKSAGIMVGTGYELMHGSGFSLDIKFRYGTGFYDEKVGDDYVVKGHNVSLGVGLNWF